MRILIPHTRELCYYSGTFFLDRIQEGLESRGAEVIRLEIPDDDFSCLEEYAGESFDAIIDINSKLPRLIDDEGRCFLDTVDAPFFNYLVDHPLYHHGGLAVGLARYHAIGVDRHHCRYMREHYPGLLSVTCLPMGGTPAVAGIPFENRAFDFLFSGTYTPEEVLEERAFGVRSEHGESTYQLMRDLYDAWDPKKSSIEEALEGLLSDISSVDGRSRHDLITGEYEARDEAELLNRLYIVDQMKRNELRVRTLTEAAACGYPLAIMGEGWEETALAYGKNVMVLPPAVMELSFEILTNAKCIIDIDPFFHCGMHDRVTSALANSCVCISDMSDEFDFELTDDRELIYYGRGRRSIGDAIRMVADRDAGELMEMAAAGHRRWEREYSWDVHVQKLMDIIKS
ncbi:MAG: hypothetical protein K6B14_04765 [Lachnospiraceae bacterium]|nr:hypothetical protein [Lachnospiraceae bacterium]